MDGRLEPRELTIGGKKAEILYVGQALGFIGLNQINAKVSMDVVPGPALPVRGKFTNEVSIGVK